MADDFKISCYLNKNVVENKLLINNIIIHDELAVNLVALAKSCQTEGEFYFFTCECGEPRCAGFYGGVHVSHLPEEIVWKMCINEAEHLFIFDPTLYQNRIDSVIRELKILHTNESGLIQLPILGQRWEDLLQLNTQVFSARLNVPEKRIVAKFVMLNAHNLNINICGMDFSIEELPLPKALVEYYKSWIKLADYDVDEIETSKFVEFLNQGRSFSHALKRYLGKQVRLKYFPPKLSSHQPNELFELFGYIK